MIGDLKVNSNDHIDGYHKGDHLYAIATLDGLLMLAKRETILW